MSMKMTEEISIKSEPYEVEEEADWTGYQNGNSSAPMFHEEEVRELSGGPKLVLVKGDDSDEGIKCDGSHDDTSSTVSIPWSPPLDDMIARRNNFGSGKPKYIPGAQGIFSSSSREIIGGLTERRPIYTSARIEAPYSVDQFTLMDAFQTITEKVSEISVIVNRCQTMLRNTYPMPLVPHPRTERGLNMGCNDINEAEFMKTLKNIKSEMSTISSDTAFTTQHRHNNMYNSNDAASSVGPFTDHQYGYASGQMVPNPLAPGAFPNGLRYGSMMDTNYGNLYNTIIKEDNNSDYLSSSPPGMFMKHEADLPYEHQKLTTLANLAANEKVSYLKSMKQESDNCKYDNEQSNLDNFKRDGIVSTFDIGKDGLQRMKREDDRDSKILPELSDDSSAVDNYNRGSKRTLRRPKSPGSDTSSSSETSDVERKTNGKKPRKVRKVKDPLPCTYCNKTFNNHSSLRQHESFHRPDRPYRCENEECEKAYKTRSELNRHLVVHSGDKQHFCKLCGKRFLRKQYLKTHLIRHHETGITMVAPAARLGCQSEVPVPVITVAASSYVSQTEPLTWRCSMENCFRIFVSQEDLDKHIRSYHSKKKTRKPQVEVIE